MIATAPTTTPKPGVYRNVPFAEYLAWDAVSKSRLDPLCEGTPAHCYDAMIAPKEETEALLIGRAYHTMVLETGEAFDAEYAVSDQCSEKTARGKDCSNRGKYLTLSGRWYCGTHLCGEPLDKRHVLTDEQHYQVYKMHEGTFSEPTIRAMLEAPGDNELSVLWQDKETGLLCKCRMDIIRPGWNTIADLKTTEAADKDSFVRAIKKYGYHRQSAFYLRAAKEAGIDVEYFAIIPQEKKRPYCANSFKFEHETTSAGELEVVRALSTYAKCKECGLWPGYDGNFEPISLSEWDIKKINSGERL